MSIRERQRAFYSELFRKHGDSPQALSYRDHETQDERFARLSRLFGDDAGAFSLYEVGCGLGHFGDYLARCFPRAAYGGCDISAEFVERCAARFPEGGFELRDFAQEPPPRRFDYVTLSGTFNPRLDTPPEEWRAFVERMLRAMYDRCAKGIAANFLSADHDPGRTDPTLHYEDPRGMLDWAVRELSRHYAIDAGGPLFEFTLLVWRPEEIRRRYPGPAFERYFGGAAPPQDPQP